MKEDILGKYTDNVPTAVRKEVDWSMDISDHIYAILKERKMTQLELSKLTGNRPAEVHRWLGGSHNFTLRTLAKISCALDVDLIHTR